MSGCMALSVMVVSISVSPLLMEDELTDMFMTSAPSRLPASSNEDWVRVEASKNRLTWVRPRSDVRFFSIWRFRSTNSSARSSSPTISSRESPSIPNKCRWWRTKVVFGAMFIKAAPIGAFGRAGKGAFETVPRVWVEAGRYDFAAIPVMARPKSRRRHLAHEGRAALRGFTSSTRPESDCATVAPCAADRRGHDRYRLRLDRP